MKKKLTLIISITGIGIIIYLFYYLSSQKNEVELSKQSSIVNYFDTSRGGSSTKRLSLDPFESDLRGNKFVLSQLVSTLVRHGDSGNIEPYLAKSWKVDNSGKVWTFKIRDNLQTELGERITPSNYKKNLERLANLYLNKKDLVLFPALIGWDEFKSSRNTQISGVEANDETFQLTFKFEKKPLGIMSYLSKPYFGFYDSRNFINGKWKDRKKVISSNTYRLESIDETKITLLKWSEDFVSKESIKKIVIHYATQKEAFESKVKNKVLFTTKKWGFAADSLEKINVTPTLLFAFLVNPYKSKLLSDEKNRRILRDTFRNIQKKHMSKYDGLYLNNFVFYTNREEPKKHFEDKSLFKTTDEEIVVLFPGKSTPHFDDLRISLKETFETLGVSYKFTDDYKNPNRIKNSRSQKVYDIEFKGVDTGAAIFNWAIDMMWCSRMGVSFPDPNGSMCNLVEDYLDKNIFQIDNHYKKTFNQIIEDDATVVPIYNKGHSYLISSDFVSHPYGVIYFNYLEFKR